MSCVYSPYLYFHHSGKEIGDGKSGPDCGNKHCIQNPEPLCCFRAVHFAGWPWAFVLALDMARHMLCFCDARRQCLEML